MKSTFGVVVRSWRKRGTRLVVYLFAGLFAVVAVALLVRSIAATPVASTEPENGVLSKVTVISDGTASGGKSVRFAAQSSGTNTGGSGGPQTDQTNLSYTANGITSKYHLYAAGLDWTKPVGLLIYADGSGEYGLKNLSSTYLMAGTNGLINVAKRNNMVLVTPLAPGGGCTDGDGSCWYLPSGSISALQKLVWAEALVKYIETQYPIEMNRVAMGGYSSGAQLAAQYWVPSGAAQRTMTDGVIVSISCGGAPMNSEDPISSEVTYIASFKANVHMNWNSGDNDNGCPHTANWSTMGGYNHYTGKGFKTSLDLLPGVTHDRSGAFGGIMDAQIKEHVAAP